MITLFKGDDTGGLLGKSVVVEISTEFDLTGCTVIFNYQGIERRWENVHDGDSREVFFSHNETARMSVGTFKAVIIAVDAAGKVRTITNSLPIKVSTNLSECYGDNVAQVTIGTTVNWERITGKPFEGQEIDIGTDDKVLAALGTIIEKLGGTVKVGIALVALYAMSAFGYTPETHTNTFVRNGVTYAQRGGLGAATYVVTNIAMTASDIGAVDTNEVRDIIRDEITPATNRLNQTLSDALDDKRDKGDLAVYKPVKSAFVLHKDGLTDVTLPFIGKDQGKPYPYSHYDWVYPIGETTSFHAIVFSDGQWKLNVDDGMEYGYSSASEDALRIEFDNGYVATRSSITSTAPVDDQQLAAVATGDAQTPANGDLVKYDASNDRFVKAVAGVDYRDPQDNACHKTELREWVADLPAGYTFEQESTIHYDGNNSWSVIVRIEGFGPSTASAIGSEDSTSLNFRTTFGSTFTATRTAVCISNDTFVTWVPMTNALARLAPIDAASPIFSNAVLAVGLNIDTNSVAVLNEIASTFGGFPIEGTATTVGGLLAALAAAIAWLKKNKVQTLKLDDNSVETSADGGVAKLDDFFTNSNSLLTVTIDDRLPIPISVKSAGFTTESYKRFVVTVSGDMTVTLHTPTSGDAEIFECRFNGGSLSADASVTFAGATATTMDTDCGTVTAGKVALMSAFWNGSTWDVNWKVEG